MKKPVLLIAIALLAASLSGCVQMHMDSAIEKDGSGTFAMTMSLSKVLTDSMEDLMSMEGSGDMEDLGVLLSANKKDLEEAVKGHNVKVKKVDRKMVDGKETIFVEMDFQDIEGLSYAMHALTGDDGGGLAIYETEDGNYTLRPHEYDWPAPPEEEEEESDPMDDMAAMDPEQMGKQMELMGKLMSTMSELEISMKITVPGDIVRSNAHEVDGRTAIWAIDGSNIMSGAADMEPDIVFSSKGLKLKAIK